MDWPLGGWPCSPAPTVLLTQIPKAQAKLLLCFCCVIFSRGKGLFEALAVGVILQRKRVQAFPESKSRREDIWLSN